MKINFFRKSYFKKPYVPPPPPPPPQFRPIPFDLSIYTKSMTATRQGINNTPTKLKIIENLMALHTEIYTPLCHYFGSKLVINSGYRCPALNKAIGGKRTSQHTKGEALDFEVWNMSNRVLWEWCENHLVFDQLILEFYKVSEPSSGWVHISFKLIKPNRHQVLKIN